ncbi:chorismate mutase [Flavobacterium sp.]|uniref:chorismate mutase n=1 Tax=Flavobacterium sp. TaxID=239 RepID=UPI0035288687
MENNNIFNQWLTGLKKNKPLIIAGPCSAETETQVLQIAHELKNSEVSIFRAGIWKPRTRPGGFEGVGAIGLKWLQKVKKETGLKIATEVANATHVQLALEHDVDVLWIGARTTVNPFAVQEIADALYGTHKIVLLKNPVNPDLSLWIGGLERLHNANIKNLGVIHRGFSTYEKTKYRNNPEWQIPIELQSKFPNLPIICDPSHITGNRNRIQEVSQQALDLNFNGLMIETHCSPDNAWSDAAQQITPNTLFTILKELKCRKITDNTDDYLQKLNTLRVQIDAIDEKLLENLGKRMQIANKIGLLKKEKNVAILQNNRWKEIQKKMIFSGKEKGLSEAFILQLFKAIHQESITHQEKVFKK